MPSPHRNSTTSSTEPEAYARAWLTARGELDPAGVLVLGSLLKPLVPHCIKADIQVEGVPALVADALEVDDEPSHEALERAVADDLDPGLGPDWIQLLAACLWTLRCPTRLARLQYPAIPEVIVEDLASVLAGRAFTHANGDVVVDDDVVGRFCGNRTAAEELATTAAHRLLRCVVGRAWIRALQNEQLPNEITVVGGWRGLAKDLGLSSRSAAQQLQRAGEALGALELRTPLGRERLLKTAETKVKGVTRLSLAACGPLATNFVSRMRAAKKHGRYLVPFRPELPALTGHRQSHPQQLSFEMLLLREFRGRARRRDDGERILKFGRAFHPVVVAEMPDEVVHRAAHMAGLTAVNREAVLDIFHAHASRGGWLATLHPDSAVRFLHGSAALMEGFLLAGVEMSETGRAIQARRARRRPKS